MSGRLFQKDKCPTKPIKADIATIVQDNIINEILDIYPDIEYVKLGSVGKKKDDDYNGDIDIGIKSDSIEELFNIIHNVFDYTDTVESKSLYIISIKYPYIINGQHEINYVSVDFIQVKNIDYTKFRYYCPDYRINESKYKVGSKIMFIGTILNHCLNQYDGKYRYKYEFLPTGLYKSIVNIKNNTYQEEFITYNPQEITNIMFYDSTPDICNSIETLWEAIHSDKFKYPENVKLIELALFINSYRKGWEELIKPEDFQLSYWTVEEIYEKLKNHEFLRKINLFLNKIQKDNNEKS